MDTAPGIAVGSPCLPLTFALNPRAPRQINGLNQACTAAFNFSLLRHRAAADPDGRCSSILSCLSRQGLPAFISSHSSPSKAKCFH